MTTHVTTAVGVSDVVEGINSDWKDMGEFVTLWAANFNDDTFVEAIESMDYEEQGHARAMAESMLDNIKMVRGGGQYANRT